MKLIKPSFLIKEQEPGLLGIYRQIEYSGRICYKSHDKITEDSAKPFVDRMVKAGHWAMLEHGTIYLTMQHGGPSRKESDAIEKYTKNKYSKYNQDTDGRYYITTNLRVLVENDWMDDLKYLCEPTEYHERRVCVHFVCDRGVSHEFIRHKIILCVA